MLVNGCRQKMHELNSSKRDDSNTRKVDCFIGGGIVAY